jgi:hypothetical protein
MRCRSPMNASAQPSVGLRDKDVGGLGEWVTLNDKWNDHLGFA